jgi:hypothetical protein
LLLAVVVLSAGACLWRSYGEIERVHVDVLSSMVKKVGDEAEAGVRPAPSDITELLYPLQRARQFTHQYQSRSDRRSYKAFLILLERYEKLVDRVDEARADPDRWAHLAKELPAMRDGVLAAAADVRAALDAETGRRSAAARTEGNGIARATA